MKTERGLLIGVVNSAWTAVLALLVVPSYLKYLGIEAYGLIGFFTTLQVVMQLLDMGLAPTVNREMARNDAQGRPDRSGSLLSTLERIYWAVAIAIALLVAPLAYPISDHWLDFETLQRGEVVNAVMLIGMVIAVRWPISLYQSAIIGLHRMDITGSVNIAMITLANLGALAILAFVSPTITAFFIWQGLVGLLQAAWLHRTAWRLLGERRRPFDLSVLEEVWRFSLGMGLLGVTAVLFSQVDKVVLSKTLPLADYGNYMLATLLVSGLSVIVTPVYNLSFPRFSALVVGQDTDRMKYQYDLLTQMLVAMVFPLAAFLSFYSGEIVDLWTSGRVTDRIGPVISIMAVGSALQGVMFIPHALQLAHGMTRLPITIHWVLTAFMLPVIILLSTRYGIQGAAVAWLLLHASYMLFGTWLTHRYVLRGHGLRWLLRDVGLNFALAGLVGYAGNLILRRLLDSEIAIAGGGALVALATVMIMVESNSTLRTEVRARFPRLGGII